MGGANHCCDKELLVTGSQRPGLLRTTFQLQIFCAEVKVRGHLPNTTDMQFCAEGKEVNHLIVSVRWTQETYVHLLMRKTLRESVSARGHATHV